MKIPLGRPNAWSWENNSQCYRTCLKCGKTNLKQVESVAKLLSGDKSSLIQEPPTAENEGICGVACCSPSQYTRPESSKTTRSKFRTSQRFPSYFSMFILCLWFRASLVYINNCPSRCNTKQSIYYSESSLYMFRVSNTPIISSTQNCNYSLRYCAATVLQRGQAWPRWREVAAQKIWPVPEAIVTVLYTPDDGCGWHPKHVEWTCRVIYILLCVASRWTVIDIVPS